MTGEENLANHRGSNASYKETWTVSSGDEQSHCGERNGVARFECYKNHRDITLGCTWIRANLKTEVIWTRGRSEKSRMISTLLTFIWGDDNSNHWNRVYLRRIHFGDGVWTNSVQFPMIRAHQNLKLWWRCFLYIGGSRRWTLSLSNGVRSSKGDVPGGRKQKDASSLANATATRRVEEKVQGQLRSSPEKTWRADVQAVLWNQPLTLSLSARWDSLLTVGAETSDFCGSSWGHDIRYPVLNLCVLNAFLCLFCWFVSKTNVKVIWVLIFKLGEVSGLSNPFNYQLSL